MADWWEREEEQSKDELWKLFAPGGWKAGESAWRPPMAASLRQAQDGEIGRPWWEQAGAQWRPPMAAVPEQRRPWDEGGVGAGVLRQAQDAVALRQAQDGEIGRPWWESVAGGGVPMGEVPEGIYLPVRGRDVTLPGQVDVREQAVGARGERPWWMPGWAQRVAEYGQAREQGVAQPEEDRAAGWVYEMMRPTAQRLEEKWRAPMEREGTEIEGARITPREAYDLAYEQAVAKGDEDPWRAADAAMIAVSERPMTFEDFRRDWMTFEAEPDTLRGELARWGGRLGGVGLSGLFEEPARVTKQVPAAGLLETAYGAGDVPVSELAPIARTMGSMEWRDVRARAERVMERVKAGDWEALADVPEVGGSETVREALRGVRAGERGEAVAAEYEDPMVEMVVEALADPLNLLDVVGWEADARRAKQLSEAQRQVATVVDEVPELRKAVAETEEALRRSGEMAEEAITAGARAVGEGDREGFVQRVGNILKKPFELVPEAKAERDMGQVWIVLGGPVGEARSGDEALELMRRWVAEPESLRGRYGATIESAAGQKARLIFEEILEDAAKLPEARKGVGQFNPAQFVVELEDLAMRTLREGYGWKEPGRYLRMANAWKGLQSEFYLTAAFSPGYAVRNTASDLFTMATDGLATFERAEDIERYLGELGSVTTRRVTTGGKGAREALTGLAEGESKLPGVLGAVSKKGQEITRFGEPLGRLPVGEEPRYQRALYTGVRRFLDENGVLLTPEVPREVRVLMGERADDLVQAVAREMNPEAKVKAAERVIRARTAGEGIEPAKYLDLETLDAMSPEMYGRFKGRLAELPADAGTDEVMRVVDEARGWVDEWEGEALRADDAAVVPGRKVATEAEEAEVAEAVLVELEGALRRAGVPDEEVERLVGAAAERMRALEEELAAARAAAVEFAGDAVVAGAAPEDALEVMLAANRDTDEMRDAVRRDLGQAMRDAREAYRKEPGRGAEIWVPYVEQVAQGWEQAAMERIGRYRLAEGQLDRLAAGERLEDVLGMTRRRLAEARLRREGLEALELPTKGGEVFEPGSVLDAEDWERFDAYLKAKRREIDIVAQQAWRRAFGAPADRYGDALDLLDSAARDVEFYGRRAASEKEIAKQAMLDEVERLRSTKPKRWKAKVKAAAQQYYKERNRLWGEYGELAKGRWTQAEVDVSRLEGVGAVVGGQPRGAAPTARTGVGGRAARRTPEGMRSGVMNPVGTQDVRYRAADPEGRQWLVEYIGGDGKVLETRTVENEREAQRVAELGEREAKLRARAVASGEQSVVGLHSVPEGAAVAKVRKEGARWVVEYHDPTGRVLEQYDFGSNYPAAKAAKNRAEGILERRARTGGAGSLVEGAGAAPSTQEVVPGYTRGDFRRDLRDVWGYPEEVAKGYEELADARARVWARQTGRPAEEWYEKWIRGQVAGGEPGPGALMQVGPGRWQYSGGVEVLEEAAVPVWEETAVGAEVLKPSEDVAVGIWPYGDKFAVIDSGLEDVGVADSLADARRMAEEYVAKEYPRVFAVYDERGNRLEAWSSLRATEKELRVRRNLIPLPEGEAEVLRGVIPDEHRGNEFYVYRGISRGELEDIASRRRIKSKGEYNFSTEQGLTFFGEEPSTGYAYAGGFAPEKYRPTAERPGYILEVKKGREMRGVDYGSYVYSIDEVPAERIARVTEIVPEGDGYRARDVTEEFLASLEEGRLLFQEAGKSGELMALHNLTADNLRFADEMGGLALPSVAVTKRDIPFASYGEITLVGDRGLVDPEVSGLTKVFDADAYSPTAPEQVWDKVRVGEAQAVMDRMGDWERRRPYPGSAWDELWDYMANSPDRNRAMELFERSYQPKLSYLWEKGLDVEPVMRDKQLRLGYVWELVPELRDWMRKNFTRLVDDVRGAEPGMRGKGVVVDELTQLLREGFEKAEKRWELGPGMFREDLADEAGRLMWAQADKLVDDWRYVREGAQEVDRAATERAVMALFEKEVDPAEYQAWVEELMGVFGPPSLRVRGRKVPYTLENMVEAMRGRAARAAEDTITYGPGKARAAGARQFGTVEEMREAAGRIVPKEEVRKFVDETQRPVLEAFREQALEHYTGKDWRGRVDTWQGLDDSMRSLGEYLKGGHVRRSPQRMRKALARNGFAGFGDELVESAIDAAELLRDTPTEYFEAKLWRGVNLDEFAGAVVPEGTPEDVLEILRGKGLEVKTYKLYDDADRMRAVQELEDLPGVVFQGKRAAVEFGRDGRALIRALEQPNVTSLAHELGHIWRRDLADVARVDAKAAEDLRIAEEWAEVVGGNWTRAAEEKWARGVERYLAEGKAPSEALARVFERFKQWLAEVYRSIVGSEIDVDLTDEVRGVMDRLLDEVPEVGGELGVASPARAAGSQRQAAGVAEDWMAAAGVPEEMRANFRAQGVTPAEWGWMQKETLSEQAARLPEYPRDLDEARGMFYGRPAAEMGPADWNDLARTLDRKSREALELASAEGLDLAVGREAYTGGTEMMEIGGYTQEVRSRALTRRQERELRRDMMGGLKPQEFHKRQGDLAGWYDELAEDARARAAGEAVAPREPPEWFGGPGVLYQEGEISEWALDQAVETVLTERRALETVRERVGLEVGGVSEYQMRKQRGVVREAEENLAEYVEQAKRQGLDTTKAELVLSEEEARRGAYNAAVAEVGAGEAPARTELVRVTAEATRRGLDQMEEGLVGDWDRWRPVVEREALRRGVDGWLQGQVMPKWFETRATALAYAKAQADFALLNYRNRRNFDVWLSYIAPYSYWYTRSGWNWAQRLAGRPGMLSQYLRSRRAMKLANENAGRRSRFERKVRVPFPWLPDWMGDSIYVDPLRLVLPFAAYEMNDWSDPDEARHGLRAIFGGLEKVGLRPYHFLELPYKAGWLSRAGEAMGMGEEQAREWLGPEMEGDFGFFLPQTRALRSATAVGRELAPGAFGWVPPGGLNVEAPVRRLMGLPAGEVWDPYRVGRTLANMAAESPQDYGLARAALMGQELLRRDETQTGRMWDPGSAYAQGVADDMGWSPEELARAQALLAEAMQRTAMEQGVGSVGWALGPSMAVEPAGERARLGLAEGARGMGWAPDQLGGSRAGYEAYRERYPGLEAHGAQYGLVPGEEGYTPGMRLTNLEISRRRDEINAEYDRRVDEALRVDPTDAAGRVDALEDARQEALAGVGEYMSTGEREERPGLPEMLYGESPVEYAERVAMNEARSVRDTAPKPEQFEDISGSVDWGAYYAAYDGWEAGLPASTEALEQVGRLGGRYAGLGLREIVRAYGQRYDSPLEAVAKVYRDVVVDGAWDEYRRMVDAGVSKGEAYGRSVGAIGAVPAVELIGDVLREYGTKGWTEEQLRREYEGVRFPPYTAESVGSSGSAGTAVSGAGAGSQRQSSSGWMWPGSAGYAPAAERVGREGWREVYGEPWWEERGLVGRAGNWFRWPEREGAALRQAQGGGAVGGRWTPASSYYAEGRWRPPARSYGGPFRG